jgi:hypothetical protein
MMPTGVSNQSGLLGANFSRYSVTVAIGARSHCSISRISGCSLPLVKLY